MANNGNDYFPGYNRPKMMIKSSKSHRPVRITSAPSNRQTTASSAVAGTEVLIISRFLTNLYSYYRAARASQR